MSAFSDRAERIAAYLVGHATAASVVAHDIDGRQGVVDFLIRWPDGVAGALEVTLVVEHASIEWQALAAAEGWRWPATSSWDFRASEVSFRYKSTRRLVLRAVELCDRWSVDDPRDLPQDALIAEPGLRRFSRWDLGSLTRSPFSPGVTVYARTTAEFIEAAPSSFSRVVETWHDQPHMASHIAKLVETPDVAERHLFLVAMDDVLPVRFFTDDFDPPATRPLGFDAVDVLWVWSNYWHRFLRYRHQEWKWIDFPPPQDAGGS
ncbi:hypothetical protein [Microbacterium karelineae]|uniref:hypothetical protein n=1 Tax=Microbacterium karelineae TaxID=2654283 RepID=UPI0012EAD73B|nr:hypothetical protein [Microbacterium karelineae]